MSEPTSSIARFRLRDLSPGARIGVACAVLVLLGGLAASARHVADHHGPKDDVKGLSLDDVMGAYHGVQAPARLAAALERGHPETLAPDAREALLTWLQGPRDPSGKRTGSKHMSEDYDNFDLGDMAPNELIAKNCLQCHSRKVANTNPIGKSIPLDSREDALRLAQPKNLTPVSAQILTTSTHTHALALGSLSVVIIGLVVATSWSRRLVNLAAALIGAGLLIDFGGQWAAREYAWGVYLLIAGGAVFGGASVLSLLAVLGDLCMPRSSKP